MNHPSEPNFNSYYQEDEISLKDLILKIIDFSRELWRQKIWIILCTLIFSAIFYQRSSKAKISYTAATSFMVSEDNTNNLIAYNPAVLRRAEKKANNKITELARSGRIIHQVLLKKVELDGKVDFLANHLIDLYKFHKKWEIEPLDEEYKQLNLTNFYFTHDRILEFSQKEKRALSITHELVAGNNLVSRRGLLSISYNDITNIFNLTTNTRNKTLASELLKLTFEELKGFYIEETVGRPQKSYEFLSLQADSLFAELTSLQRKIAFSQDQSRGLTAKVDNLYEVELKRRLERISNEFNTALNNKKKLEIVLSSGTPEFEIIDQTFFPIENKPSKTRGTILGGLIGMLIGIFFTLFRKVIVDALRE